MKLAVSKVKTNFYLLFKRLEMQGKILKNFPRTLAFIDVLFVSP